MTANSEAFRRFSLDLDGWLKSIPDEVVKPARDKIAIQALRGVVLKTPVDTGRARGNWQIGENPPEIARLDPAGALAIADGTAGILRAAAFDVITIANNLPYILGLEEGRSRQAPAGMVGLTLAEIETQFRTI